MTPEPVVPQAPPTTRLALTHRPRRLRRTEAIRSLVRETRLSADALVLPLFVCEGRGVRREVASMPGVFNLSVDEAVKETAAANADGVRSVILFGLPASKDESGSSAWDSDAPVQSAIRAIRREVPGALVFTDVCLCEYTAHGHCGLIVNGQVDNDGSLDLLTRTALSHAEAGADMVAPSDMMDGRIAAIRKGLDERGFSHLPIMAYSAKYASVFYGPFREAAESAPQFGDRRGYQMDPANAREALRELELDAAEGADILMVKPALSYLDVIAKARERFEHPLAAYNVSGEYSMIKAADRLGWLDGRRAALEVLTAIRRAGADIIITYFAKDAAHWLKEG